MLFAAAETHLVTSLSPWVVALISFAASTVAVALPLWIPLLMASRRKSKDAEEAQKIKEQEWAREDEIARRVETAAKTLVTSNAQVAATAGQMNGKLDKLQEGSDVIHTLVNASMTAAKQKELDSKRNELALMKELVDIKRHQKHEPTAETLGAIKAISERIAELQTEVEDRLKQQAEIDSKPKLTDAKASVAK